METDRVITPTTHNWRAPHSVVRKVLTEERCEFRDHVLRLSMDDRCRRFCGAVNDAFITRYCLEGRGYPRVVIGFWVDRVMRGAGEIIFPSSNGDPGVPGRRSRQDRESARQPARARARTEVRRPDKPGCGR